MGAQSQRMNHHGDGHHKPDPAAQDPALPDVVTTGPRDRDDQARVGDDEERDPDPGDEDRSDQLALGEGRPGEGELVDAQRHEVRGQARVDDGVPDRPAADETSRFTQEECRGLAADCFSRHARLSFRGISRLDANPPGRVIYRKPPQLAIH